MTILLLGFPAHGLTDKQLEIIQKNAPDMDIVKTYDSQVIERYVNEIEIGFRRFPPEFQVQAPKLAWFQDFSAGVDWIMKYPALQKKNYIITNASGINAISTSEHILSMILSFARNLPLAWQSQSLKQWLPNITPVSYEFFELSGCTALILGMGDIGARTAQLCKALDMRTIGVRRMANYASLAEPFDSVHTLHDLPQILPEADFVILALPLTAETHYVINAETLKEMKSTAYLINVGRGNLVNESSLIEALLAGQIAGAGLDVFSEEPLPRSSPLWEMKNVIITSHLAGQSPRYTERALDLFLDNLQRYRLGQPLRNVVDKALGY